jgi:hypothetical protein
MENIPLASIPSTGRPTPYDDVNAILLLLLTKLQVVLGPRLIGLYLYGSLSLGDFDPASSDIDFIAVTTEVLPAEILEQLRAMHAEIAASGLPYADHLEGSYIPSPALRRYDPHNARHPSIGTDWPFGIQEHGSNWPIEYHIVREHGVIVWGPSPQTLIDPVSPKELRAAVCKHLRSQWQWRIEDREWLRPRLYQAFAILTLCRALYTLHYGTACSKPRAASWAQATYPQWKPMIEKALAWRSQSEKDDPTETITFLREALALALHLCSQDEL